MNTRLVDAAAGVILAAMQQGKQTSAGLAIALESAQLLQSPETAAEHERIRQHALALEAAAYGDAAVRLVGSIEQIRHLHDCVAAQMNRADTLDRLCREKTARIAELERLLAEKDRPVDEDPIRYTLTEQAALGPDAEEWCTGCNTDHDPALCGYRPEGQPAEDDVTPKVARLRALLAGQCEQAGGES